MFSTSEADETLWDVAKRSAVVERDGFLLTRSVRQTMSWPLSFCWFLFRLAGCPWCFGEQGRFQGRFGEQQEQPCPSAEQTPAPFQAGSRFLLHSGLVMLGFGWESCCSRGCSMLSFQLEQCWFLQSFPKKVLSNVLMLTGFGKGFHL